MIDTVIHHDCLTVLRGMADNSVDASAKVALQAVLCYNKATKNGVAWDACNITRPRYNVRGCTMTDIIPLKRCTNPDCENPLLSATPEHFYRNHKTKDGLTERCKICINKQTKENHYKHRERKKAYQAQYYLAHQEEFKHRNAEYYATNRKDHNEQSKQYHEAHREAILRRKSGYRQQNADKIKTYFQSERGIIATRTGAQNRRAQKRKAKGIHTTEELYQQLQRQKGKCYYCHVKLAMSRNSWHADHIVPLSKGGSNSIDNIVIACPDCNQHKFNRMPHEWGDGGRLL